MEADLSTTAPAESACMIVTLTKDELQKVVFDAVTAALREVPLGPDEWVEGWDE
jgi:hypothetical protein